MSITHQEAKLLVAAAQQKAEAIGKPITVVVVDAGGFIVVSERLDGARPLTPSIAASKAYTAAVMQRPTNMLKQWCKTQPEFFAQVSTMGHLPIVATDGGLTLRRGGPILGGIGISGGTGDEDQQIAEATLAELGYDLNFAEWNSLRK
ncbi:MAG: heme-binding protein [Azospirillaceae bacterium]|nr:heme-binding protein [Azospirillaceae bacterium]